MFETKEEKLKKIIVFFASILILVLFSLGVILTLVHNNLLNQLASLEESAANQEQQITDNQDEIDARQNPDNIDDILKDSGYGTEDDVIVEIE